MNIRDFNKIIILGNGGSGKSTLGERLSKKLNIPIYHLDRLTFKTGWESVAETEFTGKLKNILTYDKWVVEGWSYNSTIPMRLQAADLIIYLEFNIWICYWYALIRHLQYSFKENPYDPPNSNIWKKTIRMVKAMWVVHKTYEPQLRNLLIGLSESKTIIRARSRRELKMIIE